MDKLDVAAKALFDHWQRGVGQAAKMEWSGASASLLGVFYGQALAVVLQLDLEEL